MFLCALFSIYPFAQLYFFLCTDRPKPPGYYDNGPRTRPGNTFGNSAWPYDKPQSRFVRSAKADPPVEVTIGDRIAGIVKIDIIPYTNGGQYPFRISSQFAKCGLLATKNNMKTYS